MTIDSARIDPRVLVQPARTYGTGQPGAVRHTETGTAAPALGISAGGDFASILREQVAGLQFSQHARQRMQARSITLDGPQIGRLHDALGTLGAKGGRTSLVMLDDVSLVVSVPNRTVITAVREPEQVVFTNIDSAIKA